MGNLFSATTFGNINMFSVAVAEKRKKKNRPKR